MNKERIKKAISTCLLEFKTCYGFKHRTIATMVEALLSSSKFMNFHKKNSTTMKYYLDNDDLNLIDKAVDHGLKLNIE